MHFENLINKLFFFHLLSFVFFLKISRMTGSFAAEVMCMMYVAGDVEEPDVRTAEYVETIGKILNE